MSFSYLSEENFEDAAGSLRATGATMVTNTHFDAQSGNAGILAIEHYSILAQTPGLAMPYEGAYCLRGELTGTTNAAYLQETGSWDTAADGTIYFSVRFWFGGQNLVMANNDLFSIFELWSGTNTVETSIFIQYTTANGYRLGANETASATGAVFADLAVNKWHTFDITADIDDGAGNDGSVVLRLDGATIGTVGSLDQGAITSGVVGVIGPDAGTTGTLLIDRIVADDAQLYPQTDRFREEVLITKSGHVLVGDGQIDNVSLLSGAGTDCIATVYDTNTGKVVNEDNVVLRLNNTTNNELVDPAGTPVKVKRGAYVQLAGTTPRAIVKFCKAKAFGSDGSIRQYGLRL